MKAKEKENYKKKNIYPNSVEMSAYNKTPQPVEILNQKVNDHESVYLIIHRKAVDRIRVPKRKFIRK